MSTRGRRSKKDLISSRHVIKHSDKSLVTADMYTEEFKLLAQGEAKQFYDRLPAIEAKKVDIPKPIRPNLWPVVQLKQAVAIASRVRASTSPFDVVVVEVQRVVGEDEDVPVPLLIGPWVRGCEHQRQSYGLNCSQLADGQIQLPCQGHAVADFRSLVDLVAACICTIPSPMAGHTCKASVARIAERPTLRRMTVDGWDDVLEMRLPVKFKKGGGGTCQVAAGEAPEVAADEAPDFNLSDELAAAMDEDDSDGVGTSGDIDCAADGVPRASVVVGLMQHAEAAVGEVADENPLAPADHIAATAIATCHDGDSTSSSSSSPSSSSTASSSSSTDDSTSADGRGPGHGSLTGWTSLECDRCKASCGEIKYHNSGEFTGARCETFFYRVRDTDGVLPHKGPLFRRKRCRGGDGNEMLYTEYLDSCIAWVKHNRKCCA